MGKALIIFIMTYIIISGRRLNFIKIGRPAGVMLGTVFMVIAKVMTPNEVYNVIIFFCRTFCSSRRIENIWFNRVVCKLV